MNNLIIKELQIAWEYQPNLSFGQLVESVENIGWELYEKEHKRSVSGRLANLHDGYFLAALAQWNSSLAIRMLYEYKSRNEKNE